MAADDCEDGWAERLAQTVVDQLRPHMPDGYGFELHGSGEALVVLGACASGPIREHRASFGMLACQDQVDTPRIERAETAVLSMLSGIEDWVARNQALPWPGAVGNIAPLHVMARGQVVEAWFGEEEAPVFPKIRAVID